LKALVTIIACISLLGFTHAGLAQNGNARAGASTTAAKPIIKLLKFYPNPAKQFITFEFVSGYSRGYSFEIYSQIGSKFLDAKNIVSRFTIQLDNYYRGVYVFVLKNSNGKVIESGKFQVIK
jgi:hypothetical protein